MITFVLIFIFLVILLLPLLLKKVEHNLELFLLVMGLATLTLSHLLGPELLWNVRLVESALMEPVKLALATLIFGLAFRAIREPLKKKIVLAEEKTGTADFRFFTYPVPRPDFKRHHRHHRRADPVRGGERHQPR